MEEPQAKTVSQAAQDGCAVDWSWLFGERIVKVTSSLDLLTITFASGLEWQISTKLWKSAPFLAFQPYEAPR